VGFDTPVGRNHQAGTSTPSVSTGMDLIWEQKKPEASLPKVAIA